MRELNAAIHQRLASSRRRRRRWPRVAHTWQIFTRQAVMYPVLVLI